MNVHAVLLPRLLRLLNPLLLTAVMLWHVPCKSQPPNPKPIQLPSPQLLRDDDSLLRQMFFNVLRHHHPNTATKVDVIYALSQAWCKSRDDSDFELLEKYLHGLKPEENILVGGGTGGRVWGSGVAAAADGWWGWTRGMAGKGSGGRVRAWQQQQQQLMVAAAGGKYVVVIAAATAASEADVRQQQSQGWLRQSQTALQDEAHPHART